MGDISFTIIYLSLGPAVKLCMMILSSLQCPSLNVLFYPEQSSMLCVIEDALSMFFFILVSIAKISIE